MSTSDEPSLLSSPPVSLPEPAPRAQLVPAPSPPPYRTPGIVSPAQPARAPVARTEPSPKREMARAEPVGDAAGEHLVMERGRYRAWMYVVIAFLLECMLLGALPAVALHGVMSGDVADALGLGLGAVLAWRVFRDRWRCIEAFSSRSCSGLMNLSLLYVPVIALVYANVRGLAKLRA